MMLEPNQELECPACGCLELVNAGDYPVEAGTLGLYYIAGAGRLLQACQDDLAVDIGPVLDAMDGLAQQLGYNNLHHLTTENE